MPDPSLSPAIIEARAVCPSDVFEIETLEIRCPDVIRTKKVLELCFIVDTYAATTGFSDIVERLISQAVAINSDLLKTYKRIRWALVTVGGTEWTFETGADFVNFTQFAVAVSEITTSVSAVSGEIYTPLREAVASLSWTTGDDSVSRHIIYVGDTPNLTTTAETINFNHTGQAEMFDNGTSARVYPLDGASGTINIAALGWNQPGGSITISGFANPENNATFLILPPANSTSWFIRDNGDPTPVVIDEVDGSVVIDGTYISITTSADTPTAAIADLIAAEIIFNQFPTFSNAHLSSIVTETEGISLSSGQLASNALVRENVVGLFGASETLVSGIDSIFIVNDTRAHSLPLVEGGDPVDFLIRGFKTRFSGSGQNGLQNLSITIDDVDRKVSQFIRRAKDFPNSVELTFRVYLSDDLTKPQNNPPTVLYLTSAKKTDDGLSCTASTIDVVNAPFPNAYYRLANFPLQ